MLAVVPSGDNVSIVREAWEAYNRGESAAS
jgi:hypothetical protein